MRKSWILIVLLISGILACSTPQEEAPDPAEESEAESSMLHDSEETPASSRGEASATINQAEIRIEYGRPQLQGRDLKSQAEEGFVWRLGMNEATTLETSKDLAFGDITVPAGTYTIFAKKMAGDQWNLVVNEETGLWGAFDHDPEQDIAEVPMQKRSAKEGAEMLTIEINSLEENAGEIVVHWGQDILVAPFTVA